MPGWRRDLATRTNYINNLDLIGQESCRQTKDSVRDDPAGGQGVFGNVLFLRFGCRRMKFERLNTAASLHSKRQRGWRVCIVSIVIAARSPMAYPPAPEYNIYRISSPVQYDHRHQGADAFR